MTEEKITKAEEVEEVAVKNAAETDTAEETITEIETEMETEKTEEVEAVEAAETSETVETEEVAETAEATESTEIEAVAEVEPATQTAPEKKCKISKKGLISLTALLLILVSVFTMAYSNTRKVSYFEDMNETAQTMIYDIYTASVVIGDRASYWSDEYNANEIIDSVYVEVFDELTANVAIIDEGMDNLKNPPSAYKDEYESLSKIYVMYDYFLEMAINPGDDGDAYYNSAVDLFEDFITEYEYFSELMMENIEVEETAIEDTIEAEAA